MLSETQALPEDPAELREAAEGLVSLVKSQALRIAKLEHQLAGLRRHRFGSTSESLDQLQLRLEDEEIAAAEAGKAVPPTDPTATPKGKPAAQPKVASLADAPDWVIGDLDSISDPARRSVPAARVLEVAEQDEDRFVEEANHARSQRI